MPLPAFLIHATILYRSEPCPHHGFIGLAVGRTTWLDAVVEWRAHTIGRDIAVVRIANRFREWAAIFDHASVR